jgi:hypothetical protein
MPTLDERLAYLEGRMEEYSSNVTLSRTDVQGLRHLVENFDYRLNARIDALDSRIDGVDLRIQSVGNRLDLRMDVLDQKVTRQFTWLVGILVASLIAVVSALVRIN